MKKTARLISILICVLLLTGAVFAQEKVEKTFSGVSKIKMDLVLGDCSLTQSSDNKVHVTLTYTWDNDEFEPVFDLRGSRLYLEEDFDSHSHNASNGYSRWEVSVPRDISLELESATGGFDITGLKNDVEAESGTGNMEIHNTTGIIEISTGTGNIIMENSQGEFDLSTGTGKVSIADSKGRFEASSGTGRVVVENITIEREADFSSGTGTTEVNGYSGSDIDLSISSGTGNAVLILKGMSLKGTVEMRCGKRTGRIKSAFPFDKEEVIEKGDSETLVKTIEKGGSDTFIKISTGTGTANLKK